MTTKKTGTLVTIHGARGEEWRRVLGTATLPVKGMVLADLPGIGEAPAYLVDLDQLTRDQVETILAHLARKFGLSDAEARDELAEKGIPILAEDTSMMTDQLWFF